MPPSGATPWWPALLRRVLLLLFSVVPPRDCALTRVSLKDVDPHAVCVDGSPAGYYWEEAAVPKTEQVFWVVYLEGGFWCWSDLSCRDRLKGQPRYGTSTLAPESVEGHGILSSAPGAALQYANKVLVPSCTSDAHMGDAAAFGLQFRGARVVMAVLKDLVRRGLGGKKRRHVLVFGGGSAGARGAMVHLDYVPGLLGPVARGVEVIGFLDSPLWIDVDPLVPGVVSFREQAQQVYEHFNVRHLSEDCKRAFEESARWKCLFGEYRMPFVKGSYLLVASQYDSFQFGYNLRQLGTYFHGMPAPNQTEQTFALFLATRTKLLLGDLASPRHMLFSFACWSHAISSSDQFFSYRLNKGPTLNDALRSLLTDLPDSGTGLRHSVSWPSADTFQWVDGCTGVACGSGCVQGTAAPAASTAAPTSTPAAPALRSSTSAPAVLVPETARRKPYGAQCTRDADCRSGLCGISCTARNASCICPVDEREDDGVCLRPGPGPVGGPCSACCATVARVDADGAGQVCVADDAVRSTQRHAYASPRGRSLAGTPGHRSSFLPAVASEPPEGAVRVIGARRFGTACQAWSECASGVCGASCACDARLLGDTTCTCACASDDVVSEARVPTCCAFFVGAEPCAASCPPCTEQQCQLLPASCRWGCTAGPAAGRCSARPEAFLSQQCQKCCNANFCKVNASGLRGDWIAIASNSGPWPGLDGKGDDLWTREDVPCPQGKAWVGGSCQVACELPPGLVVHRILDLGNSTWFQNVAFSDGAVIHAACEPGHQGSQALWTLRCERGTWNDGSVDCRPVHCPVPADPVGVWLGRGEYNQTLRLQCAEGYAATGGTSVLHCIRLGPWQVPVARCVPAPAGLSDAQEFRQGMRSAALMSVLGSAVTVSLVLVLCGRTAPQGGVRRPRAEEAAEPAAERPELFTRAGLGRGGGLE